ncbi:MAG: hypothetical protein P4M05_28165 [Bradyrhizobium sp.]|nr:hypothetical protein [Bradyrhizobium sp.]
MQRTISDNLSEVIPLLAPGALRILSRHDGAEILILHGEDRTPAQGERIAFVEMFATIEIAKSVSHFCSARLMGIPQFAPDAEGWHPFPERSLKTLVADAKNHRNVTFFPPEPKPPPLHQAWTKERAARLGFLAGQGWTAKAIADDPLIHSTADAVYRAAHRFGISLADVPPGQISLRLPASVIAHFQSAAAREHVTRDHLIRRVLIGIAAAVDEVLV